MRYVILVLALFFLSPAQTDLEERLARHRNLGKAFYENPTTQVQAVDEFKKALDLAPNSAREQLNYGLALLRAGKTAEGVAQLEKVQKSNPEIPHTWFNLGMVFKKEGEFDKSLPQFQRMIQLVPTEAVSHYNLGVLHRQNNRMEEAIREFQEAIRLNHTLAAPHFQLYNVYRTQGDREKAAVELQSFQALKKSQEGAVIPEDMEWSDYAEIYDPLPDQPATRVTARWEKKPFPAPVEGSIVIGRDVITWRAGSISANPDIKNVISAAAGDFDNDGLMDLCVLTADGPRLLRKTAAGFVLHQADLPKSRFDRAIWMDYDHDYDLDLFLLSDKPVLLRNQGPAGFAAAEFPFAPAGPVKQAAEVRLNPDSRSFDLQVDGILYRDRLAGKYDATNATVAPMPSYHDLDGDGRIDRVTNEGIEYSRATPKPNWITVQLTGVKNLKLAQGAYVEVKAGKFYQRQYYDGSPLTFEIGAYKEVDTVRITWPNGLMQNEIKQAANKAYNYKEAQRLSGSCPMIWTWNGKEFEFVTDVLGVAPLGASSGDGTFFAVDHDEYIQLPQLAEPYEIRVTEELAEVSYLDQIHLMTIDHPANEEIFLNEKWKSPPYPEFKLYSITKRIPPSWRSADPYDFKRDYRGIAEPHVLAFKFPNVPDDAVLILRGWVDWPDGSTFLAASQESKAGLITPFLQAKDPSAKWVTIDRDMGMPDGKPKYIAVPVGKHRELRIVTNLCVYWDEIFLGITKTPEVRLNPVAMTSADLHFRGFSAVKVHPERKQPDQFIYGSVRTTSNWNPTPGMYTRYGDVLELLGGVDDRYVIMGSGDELRLRFKTPPPPPPGWKRDFVLKVDGWAKDRDPNTAHSQTVEPLPFHGMSSYPYPASEQYPKSTIHRDYQQRYNQRPALRLLRPLGPT